MVVDFQGNCIFKKVWAPKKKGNCHLHHQSGGIFSLKLVGTPLSPKNIAASCCSFEASAVFPIWFYLPSGTRKHIPSWWLNQLIWKIWVKLDDFPKQSWKFQKHLKPPPRSHLWKKEKKKSGPVATFKLERVIVFLEGIPATPCGFHQFFPYDGKMKKTNPKLVISAASRIG